MPWDTVEWVWCTVHMYNEYSGMPWYGRYGGCHAVERSEIYIILFIVLWEGSSDPVPTLVPVLYCNSLHATLVGTRVHVPVLTHDIAIAINMCE